MPSNKNYIRNYKQERVTAKGRGETGIGEDSGDAIRHRARRKIINKLGIKAVKGKDVDHKIKVKNGGSNSFKNLRIRSIKANRSDNK